MAKKNLIELLTERFFDDNFFDQQMVMNKILECRSISDFEKIKLDMDSPVASGIFASANFSDPESKKITAAKLDQIFQNLKPVRGNSAFL